MKPVAIGMHVARDEEQARVMVRWLLLWAPRWDMQLEQHAYPGQPAQHSAPPADPCRCWYLCLVCGLDMTHAWAARSQGVDPTLCYPPASAPPHRATGFVINPHCPHHGRPQLEKHTYPNTTVPRWMLEDYPGSVF